MTVQQMAPVPGVAEQPVEVRVAAAAAAGAAMIPGPADKVTGRLWAILVSAISLVLVLALGGIIWTVADGNDRTSPDVIVTVFSAALTGLLGLFVKSPS